MFNNVLNEKKEFLDLKNVILTEWENFYFPKGKTLTRLKKCKLKTLGKCPLFQRSQPMT